MTEMKPFFDQVQGIYDEDHDTDLMHLFLDPTMLYSCAYFESDDMSLEEAQIAKLDLSLDKVDLHPGQTLLEVGSGWGACAYRAAAERKVNVISLTLSEGQKAYCEQLMTRLPPGSGTVELRLQGWEQFHEPVDRIISIAAFEHFKLERHAEFFERCRSLLPDDGRLMMHSIVSFDWMDLQERGIELTHENVLFMKFIGREIFPGGQLTTAAKVVAHAENAGFEVERVHSLQSHYARTLDIWAATLESNREAAIRLKSEADYDRFMKYLTGCADHFRSGHIDICQFTCVPV